MYLKVAKRVDFKSPHHTYTYTQRKKWEQKLNDG